MNAAKYWNAAAETYAQDFAGTVIGRTRREAVWRESDRWFRAGQRVLELNCGTGIDAVHMAARGVRVVACDIAPRMIELARERADGARLMGSIDFRVLRSEEIGVLDSAAPFDGAFSNFSGLNCVEDIGAVVQNLWRLLKPGAPVLISMMGRIVPWEMVWFFAQARPKKALRRFYWHAPHHAQNAALKVQCPTVSEITALFAPYFTLRKRKGIGILVPPSFVETFARKVPRTVRALAQIDRVMASIPGVRSMADCVLFVFSRNDNG